MLRSNKLNVFDLLLLFAAAAAMASSAFAQSQTTAQDDATASTTIVAQYLYASDFNTDRTSGLIAGYRISSDGKLTSIGAPTVISSRATLVPSRLGAKLFGIGRDRLWSFGVNPTNGRLKFLSVIRFPADVFGIALGINPQSTLLFVGKATPNAVRRITTYRISSSGALTPIASLVIPLVVRGVNDEARGMVVDPAGKFLYVNTETPNFTLNITQLRINETTGVLTFVRDFSLGQIEDVRTLLRSPGGAFLYQGFNTPLIRVFSVGSISGSLRQIQDVINPLTDVEGALALDAPGQFLFQSVAQFGGISVYARSSTTGLLSAVSVLSLPDTETPLLTVDATGKFLELVEGTVISTFRVGSDGVLTKVDGASASLPANTRFTPLLRVLAVRF